MKEVYVHDIRVVNNTQSNENELDSLLKLDSILE